MVTPCADAVPDISSRSAARRVDLLSRRVMGVTPCHRNDDTDGGPQGTVSSPTDGKEGAGAGTKQTPGKSWEIRRGFRRRREGPPRIFSAALQICKGLRRADLRRISDLRAAAIP